MASIIGGLIAVALGILALIGYWWRFVEVIQGLLPIILIPGGLIAFAAGLSAVKEKEEKRFKENVDEEE